MEAEKYTLDVKDVARKLGYHPQYVRLMAQQGRLPALKRIKKWVFNPQEIDQYLIDRTHEAQKR